MNFTKMNGAGNDFVVVDNRRLDLKLTGEAIARLCDRHRGIGADGLLAAEPSSTGADFRMRYYNADGGEAEMCGNGARCFARFAARLLPHAPASLSFDTGAGLIRAGFSGDLVTITISEPHGHRAPQDLEVEGARMRVHFLNTGVPHAVVFLDDVEAVDVARLGAALRHHQAFAPQGTNANFAHATSPGRLVLRTYERGVEAETLACGTGVCAAALLYHLDAGSSSPVSVQVRSGDSLDVSFDHDLKNVTLTGPADFVFEGTTFLA